MPVNWAEHEREALRLYIEEGRTAEDTIKWLNRQHDITITIRQFKTRFGGLKNLRADEWREVGKEIRRREEQGKACDVYICGRRQNPFRVKRSLRHSRNSQTSSTTTIGMQIPETARPMANEVIKDWNFEVCGHRRVEIRTLDSQESNRSENDPTYHLPVISENSRPIPILAGELALQQESEISLGDVGVDLDNIELDFSTPNLDHHFLADSASCLDTPRSIEVHNTRQNSLLTLCRDVITTRGTSHEASLNEPVDIPTAAGPSIIESPAGFQVAPSTIRLMHHFGESPSQPWDIPGANPWSPGLFELNPFDPGVDFSAIDWDRVNARVPRGEAGWLESQLRSANITFKNLKPIANVLENILQTTRGGHELRFDGHTRESLDEMFHIVTYLVSNKFLTGERLFNFIQWALDSGLLVALHTFLQKTSYDTSNFVREVLVTISDNADFKTYSNSYQRPDLKTYFIIEHSSETTSLIRAADSRTLSSSLGGKLLVHAAHSNNLDAVKVLIDRCINVNSVSTSNPENCFAGSARHSFRRSGHTTPLISAVRGGSVEICTYLLENGADVNARVCEYWTGTSSALTEAVRQKNYDMVKMLLKKGAKLYGGLMIGPSSIQNYAKKTSLEIFKLLEEVLDLNSNSEITPNLLFLVEAAERGNHALSEFLLKNSIVQNEVLEAGLCYAVKYRNIGAVRTLLHRGVDPNALRHRLSTLPRRLNESSAEYKPNPGMIYLLAKAGAVVPESALLQVCRHVLLAGGGEQLIAMVHAGFNATLVGPSALELCPPDFSIVTYGIVLDAGTDINAYGVGGKSALQSASLGFARGEDFGSDLAIIQYLLERGADVNLPAGEDGKGDDGQRLWRLTALQAAALGGTGEVVDCLLEAGADVRAPPAKLAGFTVLEAAAHALIDHFGYNSSIQERISNFRKLFARGAPVDRTDGTDCNIVHYLVRASQLQFLKEVLDAGAGLEGRERNFWGARTPIQVAAACHNIDAIQLLLDHHADINAPASNRHFGRTALQASAGRFLDDQEFRENASDDSMHSTEEVLSLLLRHRADVNAPASDDYGRTALQAAASQSEPSARVVALLLQHGAHVNAPPAELGGITALQGVAASGDIEIARMLLSWGADVNAPAAQWKGRTAIEAAAEHGRLGMVRLLLNTGAMPHASCGWSKAMNLAERCSNFEISDLLREHQRLLNITHPSLIGVPSWNPGVTLTPGVILTEDGDDLMLG
ncbi:ankyrin repeat-containing domain protein [Dactylonectria macrodidyma]|uniref:Ankyrin repeat-containing domain protein n=1 Tax=Dactylonectria macrodidyma TaxID=307937 RepID=A0A9P9E210_9HYPO|nr:ankyrin repeat-containing domain protein [Dactylonectria macrodidyma]